MTEEIKLPIAHIKIDAGRKVFHGLADHLYAVSGMASEFAAKFKAADWAARAGLWHDLGKYRNGFQRYIHQVADPDAHIERRVAGKEKTHSAAGALHAIAAFRQVGGERGEQCARVLAYLIAGHHAGLADWLNEERRDLSYRLASSDAMQEYAEAVAAVPSDILQPSVSLPAFKDIPGGSNGFALWVRMLFSCLVDADFLDTERFMDEEKFEARANFPSLETLLISFNGFMVSKAAELEAKGLTGTLVNQLRTDVLRQCREAARLKPGFFTLEVPTGGGKTLSSLAFALEHSVAHPPEQGKRRVIYAIPYTSIIEQTADVFRSVFAGLGGVVIEHHSQAEADDKQETIHSRLACENWDAPLVVTTNVQLFESLFAARTSRCRKLHNLVNSVIVLDEAQQLPPEFLQPILDAMNLLVEHYGVTVVLCTATQPALSSSNYFDKASNLRGINNPRPIITDPDNLFSKLKRVDVQLPIDFVTPTPWPRLASELGLRECVLTVVSTRRQAHDLYRLMPEGTLHLSNRMCGAHKADVVKQITARLTSRREGRDATPLRVVSTSLVEAGIDLDFPVVYRAMAGLDSIAQAAGRCNREGLLTDERGEVVPGEVVVFVPPETKLPKMMRDAINACVSVVQGASGDVLCREHFGPYFKHFYRAADLDKHEIVKLLTKDVQDRDNPLAVSFRTAAERFRLIDDADQACVIVRYRRDGNDDTIEKHLATLAKKGPERWLMRALQRYMVNIHQREADRMLGGALELAMPGLYVLQADSLYHPDLGLLQEDSDVFNPSGNVS